MDLKKQIKENRILILILLLALILRIIFVFVSPVKIWDETIYANLGYDLSKNISDYSFAHNGWSDFIPSGGDNFYAWPKAGFRAPLLPYTLSVFYMLNLGFLIPFLIPIMGVLSVFLAYVLGKKLFNKKAGLYSAVFLAIIPLHVDYSSKILTDAFVTFFILLSFIIFWKGYEEKNNICKVLFGFVIALALLARYTTLWILPCFLLYFLIRNKSLKFLKDKYLFYAVMVFFITLIPWFIYGIFTYNNPIGAFIHGLKSAAYWGGVQPWYFFFQYWWRFLSIIGFIFVFSLLHIFYKKEYMKKEIYFILAAIFFFLLIVILMPHKEDRFILPIVPLICIISGFFIDKIKRYRREILAVILVVCLISLYLNFSYICGLSYTESSVCFLKGNLFIAGLSGNNLVITDESPLTYYYTKQETSFYPNPFDIDSLRKLIDNNYNKTALIFFSHYDSSLENKKYQEMKEEMDANFDVIFRCGENSSIIYLYK